MTSLLTDLLLRQKDRFSSPYASNYGQYRVLANYFAARAEAGDGRDADRQIEFTQRHLQAGVDWDLGLMREYYRSGDANSARVVLRKIRNPTIRLEKTKRHEVLRFERLKKLGFDFSDEKTVVTSSGNSMSN